MRLQSIRPLVTVLISILALSACTSPTSSPSSSSGTTYTNSVLPSTLTITLPASLAGTTTAGTTTTASLSRIQSLKPFATTGSSSTYYITAGGYYQIKLMTGLMQSLVPVLDCEGILIDAVISQNNLSPGTYSSKTVTLTQGMYNAIAAQLPSSEAPSSTLIGTSQRLNNITYKTAGSGTFANSVQFTISDTSGSSESPTYSWSNDRTKLKMAIPVQNGTTLTITYDSATKSSAFQIVSGTMTYTMAIEIDSSSTTHGVYVNLASGSTSSGYSYSLSGYADDNGGLVKTTVDYTTDSTGTFLYGSYIEGFDGTGTLTYAVASSDGTTWSATTYTSQIPVTNYSSKETNAATMIYGATILLTTT
jgi:hypothetical protein